MYISIVILREMIGCGGFCAVWKPSQWLFQHLVFDVYFYLVGHKQNAPEIVQGN